MAKITGITSAAIVGDAGGTARTISGDVMNWSINQSRAQIDVTGIDKDFFERLPGLGDWSITISGIMNASAGQAHAVFASMGTALRAVTVSFANGGTANGTGCLESYTVGRESGGNAPFTATIQCANGTGLVWS